MAELTIPSVDLEDLASGNSERIARAGNAIKTAFGTYGLVYVFGHGIDGGKLRTLYDAFREFVAWPEAAKRPYGRADLWFQRGWTPPNTETAVAGGGQPDFKECYFATPFESDPELKADYPEIYPDNVWPESAPAGFRDGMLGLGRALHTAGLALLEGCATALELPKDAFTSVCARAAHVTRLLNYLPLNPDQIGTGILWGEEHTDFNLLTLLPGGQFYDPAGKPARKPDDKSGLFLRTRATAEQPMGIKVPGRPPEGAIVAQVGQELEILTGGAFLATPHVITAPGLPGWTRLSAAHFIHMQGNAVLYPLPRFRTPEAIASYRPPVLAGTYSLKTLVDIGLAPKSAVDKLGYRHYDRLVGRECGRATPSTTTDRLDQVRAKEQRR
jgi:isopenicillin N synthase-like dioxygenase